MKIVQVKYTHPDFIKDIEYGYCLVLDSLAALVGYDILSKGVYETGFHDAVTTAQGKGHSTSMIGKATYITAEAKDMCILDSFIDLMSRSFQSKWRAIENFGKVYIQPNGTAFFVPAKGTVEVGESLEIDNLKAWGLANKLQPRFIQWQGGSHYYVKCGTIDVVVDDAQKWDTLEAAKAAYNIWTNKGE